jgi:hypothetical protein
MHDRRLACPGPGVSETRPGRAAGRTTRRRATVPSANPAGRAAQLLSIAPARYRTGSTGGPPREPPYLALLATTPLTGVAGHSHPATGVYERSDHVERGIKPWPANATGS